MRKDVKLGLAVGGILFGAVMVYVLFFANAGKTGHDQARLGSEPSANAAKHDEAGSQTSDRGTTSSAEHPLTSLLPHETPSVTPTTQPTDASASVSIFGPTSNPAVTSPTPVEATTSSAPDTTSVSARSGSFSWREMLENGSNAASRSVTPDTNTEHSTVSNPVVAAPTQDAAPTTRPSSSGPRIYVVKPGDSLWSIAKAEYGSPSYYPHLARANPKAANRLRVGMKIVLPAKDEVVPEAAKAVLATSKVVDPTRQYRVQPGDNLYTICKKLYGRTDRVTKLYELNKDLIGPNRSALKPNMVLQLPDPPTSNTSNTAVTGGSSSANTTSGNVLAGTMN
ncbi:MAG: LysM peptidoglycan-binding domain-containing protein [Bacillota bacterium]